MARTKNFDELQVLDRAIDIFRRKGFRNTTPEELVIHLGISRSSLYNTYGDKKGLFIQALNRYQQLTSSALNNIADMSENPVQGIRDIFKMTTDGVFEETMPKGCFLVNSSVEFGPEDEEPARIVRESMESNRETLLQLVTRGQQSGLINQSVKAGDLADFLVNCLSGISISAKSGTSRQACEMIAHNSLKILTVDDSHRLPDAF